MSLAVRQHLVGRPAPIYPVATSLVTPQILRIDRYALRPGTEMAVFNLHKQMALVSAQLGYPHPFLAVESLTGPREVWRLTGYQSTAEQKRVSLSLEENALVRLALDRIEDQIRVLTGGPKTVVANFCGARRNGHSWLMGRGHFLVIATAGSSPERRGAKYQTSSGLRYWISAARTRRAAGERAAESCPEAAVFAIRPPWGMPALEWTRRDPGFWNSNPVTKRAAKAWAAFGPR